MATKSDHTDDVCFELKRGYRRLKATVSTYESGEVFVSLVLDDAVFVIELAEWKMLTAAVAQSLCL